MLSEQISVRTGHVRCLAKPLFYANMILVQQIPAIGVCFERFGDLCPAKPFASLASKVECGTHE